VTELAHFMSADSMHCCSTIKQNQRNSFST